MTRRRWSLIPALVVVLCCGTFVAAQERVLVDDGSATVYQANAVAPGIGSAWVAPSFDDSAWAAGLFGIGYETAVGAASLIRTAVPAGTASIYTRTLFEVTDAAAVDNLFLGLDFDDGVVAWINGVEVYRSPQMPPGPPAWDTAAAAHESSNGLLPAFVMQDVSSLALPSLVSGSNLLAIGVWNTGATSSDLVLVPRVIVNRPLELLRGPYLQAASPTSVAIRWRTDEPVGSRVLLGPAPGELGTVVDDPTSTTEHIVALSGLTPATRYYYAIGEPAGRLYLGADVRHQFTTPPATSQRHPFRVWVVGDSGTGSAGAAAVRDAFRIHAFDDPAELWLMLGDNAYPSGTDQEYQTTLFDFYPSLLRTTTLWPTLGNHDGISASSATESGPYYDIFTLPAAGESGGLPSGTEAYYSFDHANVHFIVLNSQDVDRGAGGAMATWLAADLASTAQEWIIALWHHPPYSKGSHNSDTELPLVEMREQIVPILEDYGVDLVLTGHSHSYERSFLIDGHYGDSSTFVPSMAVDAGDGSNDGPYLKPIPGTRPYPAAGDGAVYAVVGSSGSVVGGLLNHPVMVRSLAELGSLILDFDGTRLDGAFLGGTAVVQDRFTILKPDCPGGFADADGDRVCDDLDNCPATPNTDQLDADADTVGDACDACPLDFTNDPDGDGVCDDIDNCVGLSDPDQTDSDGDGLGDLCDGCPLDPAKSAPGVCGCGTADDDSDGDGVADCNDPCPHDAADDADQDGVCADLDNCPSVTNDDQRDRDEDGLGDECDNCKDAFNPDQADADGDGQGDLCDGDGDGDGIPNNQDNCELTPNTDQADFDADELGDACDNCPDEPNTDQQDQDADGAGDVCDCLPGDPGVQLPPVEVAGVVFTAGSAAMQWLPDPGAEVTGYDVARGDLGGLPVGGGAESCAMSGAATSFVDPSNPPAGLGYYYLVRAVNACGTGTYGRQTSGLERSSPACP